MVAQAHRGDDADVQPEAEGVRASHESAIIISQRGVALSSNAKERFTYVSRLKSECGVREMTTLHGLVRTRSGLSLS